MPGYASLKRYPPVVITVSGSLRLRNTGYYIEDQKALTRAANKAIASVGIPHENSEHKAKVVTSSIGLYVIPGDEAENNRQVLISLADRAWYQAKSFGRNRVEVIQCRKKGNPA